MQYTPVLLASHAPKCVFEVNVPVILKNIDIFKEHCISLVDIFRSVRIAKNDSLLRHARLSVCPSFRTEQLCSHWTDFHEILCFSFFRKSVEKILVLLKPDKNNVYFT